MDVRRTLAVLLTAAVCSFALTLSTLMPAHETLDPLDPLEPLAPLASLDAPLPADPVVIAALHAEASAALSRLQAAHVSEDARAAR
jgi:hypothetical protein